MQTAADSDAAAPSRTAFPGRQETLEATAWKGRPTERLEAAGAYLRDRVADALGFAPQDLPCDVPLTELGIDSMMAVELSYDVQRELHVNIPFDRLLAGPSLDELSRELAASLAEPLEERARFRAADRQ